MWGGCNLFTPIRWFPKCVLGEISCIVVTLAKRLELLFLGPVLIG